MVRVLQLLPAAVFAVVLLSPRTLTAQPPAPAKPDRPAPFTLTISGELEEKDAEIAGKLTKVFYESYPRLVERFENPKKPAPRTVKLVFKRRLRVPAYCTGDEISVSLEWLRSHPDDVGLLAHELTHVVQAYPPGSPGWMTEGLADYARHVYGPKEQPGWSLPRRLTAKNKYTDSYRVTGRFLLWLDEKHPGTVDKLHRLLQDRKFDMAAFKELTGEKVETLWDQCVADLAKKP